MNLTTYTGIQNLGVVPFTAGIALLGDTSNGFAQNLGSVITTSSKTPVEVIGELVLRPLIDATSQAFSTLWRCARTLDKLTTFPGAAAAAPYKNDKDVQELDISSLSSSSFYQIFLGNPTHDEDKRRIQLLNEKQVKVAFNTFFSDVSFQHHLTSSQLRTLESSLTDQEIATVANKIGPKKLNNLPQPLLNRYIQKLDVSRLDANLFYQIFLSNSIDEDERRIQLLNEIQVKATFNNFFGDLSYQHNLTPSQLKTLKSSLTDQEIAAAVNKIGYKNMNTLPGPILDRYIQKLDIALLSTDSFYEIFLGSPSHDEDKRRIQLLNKEQVNAAFYNFFGKVAFQHHLSSSQLITLESSLTDQEIATVVKNIGHHKLSSLPQPILDRYIKKLDVSQLSINSFLDIFSSALTEAEKKYRLQLLDKQQLKAAFNNFIAKVTFQHHLSSTQVTVLETSLTDREIATVVDNLNPEKINTLPKPILDRYIQKLDISLLSSNSFHNIFLGSPSHDEDKRRIQLLNKEQVNAAFYNFFGKITFQHHLSSSQLKTLESSLTDQEIATVVKNIGHHKLSSLPQPIVDRYIQKLDISLLSTDSFHNIFLGSPSHDEDKRRIQLMNEEQVKAAHKSFSGTGFKSHLSPSQLKIIEHSPAEPPSKQTTTTKTTSSTPVEKKSTDAPISKPLLPGNMKRHITFGTTYVKGNPQRDALSQLIDDNHREYAKAWNLQHRVVKEHLMRNLCTRYQQPVDCVPYWNKVAVLKEWVNKPAIDPNSEEWYILADDDMPVTNMKVDPYKAIDTLRRNIDTSIIIARDVQLWKNGDLQLSVNTGLLFVRKDANGKKFIEDLWNKRNTPTGSRNNNCQTLGTCQNQEVLHEQEAFAQLLQNDKSLINRVVTVVKPRDSYKTTESSSEEIALNTYHRGGCFRRQQEHWGSEAFSYGGDAWYPEGKWKEGDWMGQTAGVPVNGWWCGDYNNGLPPGPIRQDMLKQMIAKIVR